MKFRFGYLYFIADLFASVIYDKICTCIQKDRAFTIDSRTEVYQCSQVELTKLINFYDTILLISA